MRDTTSFYSRGYISLMVVLVTAAMLFVFSAGVALQSTDTGQEILSTELAMNADALLESCANEALMQLNMNNTLPTTIILPESTCAVRDISNSGDLWSFQVSALYHDHAAIATISATRSGSVTLTSWQQ